MTPFLSSFGASSAYPLSKRRTVSLDLPACTKKSRCLSSNDSVPIPSVGPSPVTLPVSNPQPQIPTAAPVSSPLPLQTSTTDNLTQLDFQSLPSPPDRGYYSYIPSFGEEVCKAYSRNMMRHGWRVAMYGEEVANEYKCGFTPSPARRALDEARTELKIRDALGTPGVEQSEDEVEAPSSALTSPLSNEEAGDNQGKQAEGAELNARPTPGIGRKRWKDSSADSTGIAEAQARSKHPDF